MEISSSGLRTHSPLPADTVRVTPPAVAPNQPVPPSSSTTSPPNPPAASRRRKPTLAPRPPVRHKISKNLKYQRVAAWKILMKNNPACREEGTRVIEKLQQLVQEETTLSKIFEQLDELLPQTKEAVATAMQRFTKEEKEGISKTFAQLDELLPRIKRPMTTRIESFTEEDSITMPEALQELPKLLSKLKALAEMPEQEQGESAMDELKETKEQIDAILIWLAKLRDRR